MLSLATERPTASTATKAWLTAMAVHFAWDEAKVLAITTAMGALPGGFPDAIGELGEEGSLRGHSEIDIKSRMDAGVFNAMRRMLNESVTAPPFEFAKPPPPAVGPEKNLKKTNTSNNPDGTNDPNFHVPTTLTEEVVLVAMPTCITKGVANPNPTKPLMPTALSDLSTNVVKYLARKAGVVHPLKSGSIVSNLYNQLIEMTATKYSVVELHAKRTSALAVYKKMYGDKFVNFRGAAKVGNNQIIFFNAADMDSPEIRQLLDIGIKNIKLDASLPDFLSVDEGPAAEHGTQDETGVPAAAVGGGGLGGGGLGGGGLGGGGLRGGDLGGGGLGGGGLGGGALGGTQDELEVLAAAEAVGGGGLGGGGLGGGGPLGALGGGSAALNSHYRNRTPTGALPEGGGAAGRTLTPEEVAKAAEAEAAKAAEAEAAKAAEAKAAKMAAAKAAKEAKEAEAKATKAAKKRVTEAQAAQAAKKQRASMISGVLEPRRVGTGDPLLKNPSVQPPLSVESFKDRHVFVPSCFWPAIAAEVANTAGFIGQVKTKAKSVAKAPDAFSVLFEDGPAQFYITPPSWTAEGFCCLNHPEVKMLS